MAPKVASRLSEDQKKLAKSLPNNRILFFFPSSAGDDEFVQFISNNGNLAPKWRRAKALVVEQLKGKTPLAKEDSELLTRAENSILVKGVLDYVEAVYNLQDCETRMQESETSLSVFQSHINFLFARLDAVRTRISPDSRADWNVAEEKNITFASAVISSRADKEIFTQMLCDGEDPQRVKEAIENFLLLLDQIPVEDCDLPYKRDTTFKFDDNEDRQVMYTWWEKTLNRKKQGLARATRDQADQSNTLEKSALLKQAMGNRRSSIVTDDDWSDDDDEPGRGETKATPPRRWYDIDATDDVAELLDKLNREDEWERRSKNAMKYYVRTYEAFRDQRDAYATFYANLAAALKTPQGIQLGRYFTTMKDSFITGLLEYAKNAINNQRWTTKEVVQKAPEKDTAAAPPAAPRAPPAAPRAALDATSDLRF